MLDPMDLYRMQAEGQAFSAPQLQGSPQDNQNYISQSPIMQMASASAPASPAYAPSSGAQKEDASRNSVDSIIAHMAQQRAADRQNDRNLQWMTFFSKLASSKNPTLLGGLGESADALSEVTGKQAQSNKILDQSALEDQLKVAEWNREQERQEAAQKSTEAYQQGELGIRGKALDLQRLEANKPIFDKAGNPWQLDKNTGTYVPLSKGQIGSDVNEYGYKIGTIPEGTSAPVIDPRFDPTSQMPPVQKAIYATNVQKQLEKDNKDAMLNDDAIERLKASRNTIMTAPTGGFTNLIGVGPIATAFSTQRQEMDALNKELAMAPGERPTNMRLTQGEVMMLKQAQPGTDKSPEANAAIADANIAIRSRPSEFANFKNDFVANNGYWNDAVGQQMYSQYIKDNPIIDVKKSGKGIIALNPNRQTIAQYASNGGFKRFGVNGNPQGTAPNAQAGLEGNAKPPAIDNSTAIQHAKDAIAAGAPRDAVMKRLNDMGISGEGL